MEPARQRRTGATGGPRVRLALARKLRRPVQRSVERSLRRFQPPSLQGSDGSGHVRTLAVDLSSGAATMRCLRLYIKAPVRVD
jgi:hypothetical protein